MDYETHNTTKAVVAIHPTTSVELVENGEFQNAVDEWALGTGWAVSGGVARFTGTVEVMTQTLPIVATRTYKIEYKITDVSNGYRVKVALGGIDGTFRGVVGSFSETFTVASTANLIFTGDEGSGGGGISIDDVVVREITPGTEFINNGDFDGNLDDWGISVTSGAGWIFSGGKALKQLGSESFLFQFASGLNEGDVVKIKFDVGDFVKIQSNVFFNVLAYGNPFSFSGNGSFEDIINVVTPQASLKELKFLGEPNFQVSIDNVSVTGEDTFGPDIVVDGDFSDQSVWSFTGNWAINASDEAFTTAGVVGTISQAIAVFENTLYRVEYTIDAITGGTLTVSLGGNDGTPQNSTGTFSEDILAGPGNQIVISSESGTAATIDDVRVVAVAPTEIIDTLGFGSLEYIIETGEINGDIVVRAEESDNSDMSDPQLVDPANVIGTIKDLTSADDNQISSFGIVSKKRFQRIVMEATVEGDLFTAVGLLGHALTSQEGVEVVQGEGTDIYNQTDLMSKKDKILKTGISIKFLEKGAWLIYPKRSIKYDVGDIIDDIPKDKAKLMVQTQVGEYYTKPKEIVENVIVESKVSEEQLEPHVKDKKSAEKFAPSKDKKKAEKKKKKKKKTTSDE